MKIMCRSMDINEDDLKKILKDNFNDAVSIMVRLSNTEILDLFCLCNLFQLLDENNFKNLFYIINEKAVMFLD